MIRSCLLNVYLAFFPVDCSFLCCLVYVADFLISNHISLQMSGRTSLLELIVMKIHRILSFWIARMIPLNFGFGLLTGDKHWPELVDVFSSLQYPFGLVVKMSPCHMFTSVGNDWGKNFNPLSAWKVLVVVGPKIVWTFFVSVSTKMSSLDFSRYHLLQYVHVCWY